MQLEGPRTITDGYYTARIRTNGWINIDKWFDRPYQPPIPRPKMPPPEKFKETILIGNFFNEDFIPMMKDDLRKNRFNCIIEKEEKKFLETIKGNMTRFTQVWIISNSSSKLDKKEKDDFVETMVKLFNQGKSLMVVCDGEGKFHHITKLL